MNPFETSVAVDPNLSFSVLNVTNTGKKGGQSEGIPIPLGLQPPGAQNQVCLHIIYPNVILIFQSGPSDQGNYDTTRSHVDILLEQRDRAQNDYHGARQAWETFRSQAKDWAVFTNRIHRTPEEESLVNSVSIAFLLEFFNYSFLG